MLRILGTKKIPIRQAARFQASSHGEVGVWGLMPRQIGSLCFISSALVLYYPPGYSLPRGGGVFNRDTAQFLGNLAEMEAEDRKAYR